MRAYKDAMDWLLGDDVGTSSRAIMSHMEGRDAGRWGFDYPHDPADFARCYRLMLHFPLYRPRLGEMAKYSAEWKRLATHWDEIEVSFLEECRTCGADPTDRNARWMARRTYDLMRNIIDGNLASAPKGGA